METEVTSTAKAGWGSKSRQRGTGGCCWARRHEGEDRDRSEQPRDTPKVRILLKATVEQPGKLTEWGPESSLQRTVLW